MFIIIAPIQDNDRYCPEYFTPLALAVDSLLLVELSLRLCCKLSSVVCLCKGEEGSLRQLDVWSAGGV